MEYRRARVCGGLYFITIVTHRRRPILSADRPRSLLHQAIETMQDYHPFSLSGLVLLPDHLHLLMRLPQGDDNISGRIGGIKKQFTHLYLSAHGQEARPTPGAAAKGYRGVWQPRFWDHVIRDAKEYQLHLDYIHANPVKHGLVQYVRDWAWSSFHRYVQAGVYESDWAGHVELPHEVEYYLND